MLVSHCFSTTKKALPVLRTGPVILGKKEGELIDVTMGIRRRGGVQICRVVYPFDYHVQIQQERRSVGIYRDDG